MGYCDVPHDGKSVYMDGKYHQREDRLHLHELSPRQSVAVVLCCTTVWRIMEIIIAYYGDGTVREHVV